MNLETSTDELLKYIDGSLTTVERSQILQTIQEYPPMSKKLEGLFYLYEKFNGDVPRIKKFLYFQQRKVWNKLLQDNLNASQVSPSFHQKVPK